MTPVSSLYFVICRAVIFYQPALGKRWSLSILGLLDFAKKTQDIQGGFFKRFLAHFFFLSILQRSPRIIFHNYLQRRPSILKEVFWPFLPLFLIQQRRPSIFKEFFWQFQHFLALFKFYQDNPVFLRRLFTIWVHKPKIQT